MDFLSAQIIPGFGIIKYPELLWALSMLFLTDVIFALASEYVLTYH